ncbi:MAG TPA: hypothetical protein VF774_00600, partial [Pseudoduganella sp.]
GWLAQRSAWLEPATQSPERGIDRLATSGLLLIVILIITLILITVHILISFKTQELSCFPIA